ncbi:hypothetical protein [Streptomyces huiliensis]|uniref:hypothetical protein n=1 Tax=Streptomyces huiliensis TaxID=2876027 RepID=UPI001CC0BD72|nr:hypothetical protein [Streptomyces huiliensis]MBZ4322236.1 hypothetical protein [Streptomyces huiliensis]
MSSSGPRSSGPRASEPRASGPSGTRATACSTGHHTLPHRRPGTPRPCPSCRSALRICLGELPEIYADCEAALLPRRQGPLRPVGGPRRPSGPPLDEGAMATRSRILGTLSSWAALVADERGAGAPRRRPAELAAFLLVHLDWLLCHAAAGDFVEELLDTADHARRSAYVKPSLAKDLGRCVHPGCERPLSPVPAAGTKGVGQVRCAAGHTWLPHQWLALMRNLRRERRPGRSEGAA